jgi:hypothetical protein
MHGVYVACSARPNATMPVKSNNESEEHPIFATPAHVSEGVQPVSAAKFEHGAPQDMRMTLVHCLRILRTTKL